LKLSSKLRSQLPELNDTTDQLFDSTLHSTRLFLLADWKRALTDDDIAAVETAAKNFQYTIRTRPLPGSFIQTHGLIQLLQDTTVRVCSPLMEERTCQRLWIKLAKCWAFHD
jgi:hypothetical protein